MKQVAALKQKAAEAQVKPESQPTPWDKPVPDHPDTPDVNPVPQPVTPPQPPQPQNRHFTMTATLDNTRVVKNIGNLMDEIINHLMQIDGANVEIRLLVEADMPNGTPVTTVRAIRENCATLKVDDFGFEE